jgi:pimeloyl-ACP methyl ester carboxylesterase
VRIHYREIGKGKPLIFLHGGWGYQIYPFDRQIEALQDRFRVIIPDRSGYGRSLRIDGLPTDFHQRAAVETKNLIDALALERPVLWGHSDGAVISALMGLENPGEFAGVILEAFHFLRCKPGSRPFFETMSENPRMLGERVTSVLASDHGEDYWQRLIVMNGRAWLGIADEAAERGEDLYDGRLADLAVPVVLLHGSRDPRTEPGELDRVAAAIGQQRIKVIEGGGHSPHSESAAFPECGRLANDFLNDLA